MIWKVGCILIRFIDQFKNERRFYLAYFWGFELKLRECLGLPSWNVNFGLSLSFKSKVDGSTNRKTHNPAKYKLIKHMKVKKFDFRKYLLSFNLPTAKQKPTKAYTQKNFPHQPLRQVNRYLSRVINIRFTLWFLHNVSNIKRCL